MTQTTTNNYPPILLVEDNPWMWILPCVHLPRRKLATKC